MLSINDGHFQIQGDGNGTSATIVVDEYNSPDPLTFQRQDEDRFLSRMTSWNC